MPLFGTYVCCWHTSGILSARPVHSPVRHRLVETVAIGCDGLRNRWICRTERVGVGSQSGPSRPSGGLGSQVRAKSEDAARIADKLSHTGPSFGE
jgi:hypothetical protein